MLLAIGHDNTQVVGAAFNELFLPVHWPEIEYCKSCHFAFRRWGHTEQNPR